MEVEQTSEVEMSEALSDTCASGPVISFEIPISKGPHGAPHNCPYKLSLNPMVKGIHI